MGSSLPLQGGTVLAKSISEVITQTAHGFAVGDVIRWDVSATPSARWVKAQANNATNAEVAGVVSNVQDSNAFTVVYSGYIDLSSSSYAGISFPAMFLSSTIPGGMTASPPSAIGTVVKPVVIRTVGSGGYLVVNYLGTQIGGSSTVAIDQIQPVGTVMPYAGSVTPDTWLECSGLSYAISEYTELYDRTLYPAGDRVPMYGYVVTLTGTNVSAAITATDILQFKNNTSAWSGGLYDSNAEMIGVVLSTTSTTAVVQTLPVYNSTTKTFSSPNVTFKAGNGTGTQFGTSQYRFWTNGGSIRGNGGSTTFTGFSITHFNTPDMRGRFALGTNTNAIGELESDTGYFSAISGVYPLASEGGQESTIANSGLNTSSPTVYGSVSTVSGGTMANMPPYLALRYIIKAKPYTRAAIIDETEINYPNLLVTDLRSGLMRGAGAGEDLVFKTNTGNATTGTERMRLTNSGSLGLGVASPSTKIETNGSVRIGIGNDYQFDSSLKINAEVGGSSGYLRFFTNSTERLRIDGNGNVGIGTLSPAAPLHLRSSGSCELRLTDSLVTNADWGILPQTNNTTKLFRIIDRNTGSGGFADRLVIDSSGRIGIGTSQTTGNSRLTVSSSGTLIPGSDVGTIAHFAANATNNLSIGKSGVDYCGIGYNLEYTANSGQWTYRGANTSSLMRFTDGGFDFLGTPTVGSPEASAVLTKWMTIAKTGNVAIGIDPDTTYRLRVQGKIFASDDIVAFSDARQKRDIAPITDALHKVRSLVGVLYTDSADQRKTGLLAQDVQAVLPEAVTTDEHGNLALAYGNLAGVLVQAIKELAIKVEELEKR